ncbi:MAG: hypothetical protein ACU85V_00140 [Gammaproteobacteria bacterium]
MSWQKVTELARAWEALAAREHAKLSADERVRLQTCASELRHLVDGVGLAGKRLPFSALPLRLQDVARGRFIDARDGDGWTYEIDRSGGLLCRSRGGVATV